MSRSWPRHHHCFLANKSPGAPQSSIRVNRAMSSNAMRDARFCWAGRFCKRLWPFLVAKAVSSTKIAPTQHNDGVNCDQLVRLLEPIAQPTPVFRPFFARSPKVLTKRFTWHPKTSRVACRLPEFHTTSTAPPAHALRLSSCHELSAFERAVLCPAGTSVPQGRYGGARGDGPHA